MKCNYLYLISISFQINKVKDLLAQRQAALQNQSTYNGFLHLGEVQQLNAKKHAIGLTELYKIARRTRAAEKVKISEQGGSASQTGAKRLQVLNAEALDAARRKNENFETLVKDFEYKKRNLTLENISANNRTFSGLSTLPSKTGLIIIIRDLTQRE